MSTPARVDILIDIKARLDELVKSQEAFRKMKEEGTSFGTMFKTGLGIDFARRGVDLFKATVIDAVRASSGLASEIERASNRLGLSGEAYQTLAQEARAAGTEFTEMLSGLNRYRAGLGAALLDPRKGSVLSQLGLDPERLSAVPMERQLEQIAAALAQVADGSMRARLQQELFGQNASALTPVLERLRVQGYDKLKDAAAATAAIMDDRMANALNSAQTNVQEAQKRLSIALAPVNLQLLNLRAGATNMLARNAGTISSGVEAGFAGALAHALTSGLEKAAATAERSGGWRKAGERLGTLLAGPAGVAFATALGGFIIKEIERRSLASNARADAFDAAGMGNISGIHRDLPLVDSEGAVIALHNRGVAALQRAREARRTIIQTPAQGMTDEKRDNLASLEREIAGLERLIPLIKEKGMAYAHANAAARIDFERIAEAQTDLFVLEANNRAVQESDRRSAAEKQDADVLFLRARIRLLSEILELTKKLPLAQGQTAEMRSRELNELAAAIELTRVHGANRVAPPSEATQINTAFEAFSGGKDSQGGALLAPGEGFTAGLQQWAMQAGTVGQQIAGTLTGVVGGAVNSLSNSVMGLITKTKSLGDAGREMGAMFVQAIVQMIVQALALAVVMGVLNILTGGAIAAGGFTGGFMKGLTGRASGGPVAAGQPYVVGEDRAEVFVPTGPGSIIPSVDAYRVMARRAGGGSAVGGGGAAGGGPVGGKRQRDIWIVGDMFTARTLARDSSWDNHVMDTVRRHKGDLLDS